MRVDIETILEKKLHLNSNLMVLNVNWLFIFNKHDELCPVKCPFLNVPEITLKIQSSISCPPHHHPLAGFCLNIWAEEVRVVSLAHFALHSLLKCKLSIFSTVLRAPVRRTRSQLSKCVSGARTCTGAFNARTGKPFLSLFSLSLI